MTRPAWASRALGSIPFGVRWRARNALTTARWTWLRASGRLAQAYDQEFWDYHDSGDWAGFADVLLRHCQPASLVDVGCGDAKLLAAMRRHDRDLPLLGIDSSPAAVQRASAAGVVIEASDLASTRAADLERLQARIAGFDVAVSLETAEHLPFWSGRSFVSALAQARLVVFSAAQPYQGGTLHVNERPREYWARLFAAHGFRPAPVEAAIRADVSPLHLHWCYAANIQVFERT